jgi:hypothetical protein
LILKDEPPGRAKSRNPNRTVRADSILSHFRHCDLQRYTVSMGNMTLVVDVNRAEMSSTLALSPVGEN